MFATLYYQHFCKKEHGSFFILFARQRTLFDAKPTYLFPIVASFKKIWKDFYGIFVTQLNFKGSRFRENNLNFLWP